MSERRYEVSFRAELDDRQVDEVADTLFDLGWDDICFRPIADPDRRNLYPGDSIRFVGPKLCPECGDRIINRGAHAERCTGRMRA